MSSSPETDRTIQARAEQLIAEAEVVNRCNHDRREMLVGMMDAKAFDSAGGLDDSMASMVSVEGGAATLVNGEKSSEKRKSRFQTVSELKQQLHDCHKALLTMQENANLKYRKLELQNMELKAALDSAKTEIVSCNAEVENLEIQKRMLEESLHHAMGKEQADYLNALKVSNNTLEKTLAQVKRERDDALKEKDDIMEAMIGCSVCSKKIPNQHTAEKSVKGAVKGTSFWTSFNEAMKGLTTEAQVTASPQMNKPLVSVPNKPPAALGMLFKEQSEMIKVELEADIEEMEKQMKDDIEALKSEWAKPSPKSSGRGRRRHHSITVSSMKNRSEGSRRKSVSTVSAGFSSLDSFFASASHELNLEDEEMDEERSFYSMSRSVATAPVAGGKKRRKKKSSSHHRKQSISTTSSDQEGDRRSRYGSQNKSFRESFRAQLLGLGDEVKVSSVARRPSLDAHGGDNDNGRLDELQREVAEWRGSANHALTVL